MNTQKKLIAFIMAAMLLVAVGCSKKPAPAESQSPETPLPVQTEEPVSAEPASMEETVRDLFDRHLDCMLNVMELSELSHEQPDEMPQDGLVPVTDERFPDYAAFEAYIRSIYSKGLADFYLNDFPYQGEPKYVNVDGALYLNLNRCGGKGYYVDWTDYTVDIYSAEDTVCSFTATGSETLPGENPTAQEHTVEASLVKEADGWRMSTQAY